MRRGIIVPSLIALLASIAVPSKPQSFSSTKEEVPAVISLAAVESPSDLISLFAHAYRSMDLELYGKLFVREPGQGVGFRFILNRPTETGESEWGYAEEMRIHRRMFRPESITPNEKPLPRELWIRSIQVRLVPVTDFRERFDLYISEHNPMGELDRKRWRATDAVYETDVTWLTQGGHTMHIAGQARFIVIEDLWQALGSADKFLLYRWEDLGAGEIGVAQSRP